MPGLTYSQLKGQLLILQQISNPSPYILEAINQIGNDIERLEKKDSIYISINKATEEIERIRRIFPELNIEYSINAERPAKVANIKEDLKIAEKPAINIVTHINAFNKNYTFKDPRSIIFQNKEYSGVIYWKDVLETVCNLMQERQPEKINRILSIQGRTRLYFATSLSQLNSEEQKMHQEKSDIQIFLWSIILVQIDTLKYVIEL